MHPIQLRCLMQKAVVRQSVSLFHTSMASSLLSLPSIINQPHSVLRLKLHTRCCFNLRVIYQKPQASSFSRSYGNRVSCSLLRPVERDFNFKLARNLSQSNIPLPNKSEGPSLRNFIAHATLTATEVQPK